VATEVNLPQWGMGMTEGMITEWLKREGDPVTEDEEIAEVETEKLTSILIAPASGRLIRILVPAGETVPVFTTLALIEPLA
jgi:pyruvate/2-oxoglutarate dehydrogenase complex dihydrolipoamide acyltransferase (E2) component